MYNLLISKLKKLISISFSYFFIFVADILFGCIKHQEMLKQLIMHDNFVKTGNYIP